MKEAIDKPTAEFLSRENFKTALVIGPHPTHKHACGCECNSPYCEDVNFIPCQNHGGPPRVHKGLEPWRGR